ncbi:chemotaxis protein CheA [Marinisporobacter balticus]|uniref:Chemotaxis protein CheA n=1 Tax=Marinisporobacter balticus TaxID=2018667 RepID=A0A4R2KKX0_9FIRM|nr:chemotaxis protein CheA [Marinisporobacter balticus]TCO73137.1 two-component system chemotaxis sensor kinase CheA [Marinisporobacter balticus]
MSGNTERDPMLEMYIFESNQLLEQLEQVILSSEKSIVSEESINEIFRIMHTIKGNSAMMLFNNIATLAHALEDLFDFLRQGEFKDVDSEKLIDRVFSVVDFIKGELFKIEDEKEADADPEVLMQHIKEYLLDLKENNTEGETNHEKKQSNYPEKQQYYISSSKSSGNKIEKHIQDICINYKAVIYFEEACQMENMRAYTVVRSINEIAMNVQFIPADILENDKSSEVIKKEGFTLLFKTDVSEEALDKIFQNTVFLKEYELMRLPNECDIYTYKPKLEILLEDSSLELQEVNTKCNDFNSSASSKMTKQSSINVKVNKLDMLMDLVGELVISEAMVTQNPELQGLNLDNFNKAARQLHKITNDLQDVVMSIRMVPLSLTFQKMNRLVRDMSKKINKEVELKIIGEETEVDKNIIENISDPLMHLIRNAMDHGIESSEKRVQNHKPKKGKIILQAKNSGGDVLIIVKDDGQGLSKEKIINKAFEKGLIDKEPKEMTDKEIYSLIFLPGFSTNEEITEYSGRGVGMDVVTKNIERIKGKISVDSIAGQGTTITIKIPLTLAIIEGMIISVGGSTYTIPIVSIRESFRPKEEEIIVDLQGNEMILIRGQSYPIVRIHERYHVNTKIKKISEGILIMVECDEGSICIFADTLLGEQQVVVKPLPKYVNASKSLSGCTLLGDGSISLILDVAGLIYEYKQKGRDDE